MNRLTTTLLGAAAMGSVGVCSDPDIVFARNAGAGPRGDVYTMSSDGAQLRRVTRRPSLDARHADWKP